MAEMADLNEFSGGNTPPPIIDYFAESRLDYADFDKKAWSKGKGYHCPNYLIFDKLLEGLDMGLYLFAGEANAGKSAFVLSLLYDYCTNANNKLYGIYYSLDDSKDEIIARTIAQNQSIPINVVSKPQRYKEFVDNQPADSELAQEYLIKREQGLKQLEQISNMFKIVDGEKITSGEELLQHAKNVQVYVKSLDLNANIIIGIDSVQDLNFKKGFSGREKKDKNDFIAKEIKRWAATELKVPIFGTLHLRKLNQNRRPNADDVKESGEYMYEANALMLLHNDVGKNNQASPIYWRDPASDINMPVLELDWVKNKKSSYKGKSYYYFHPNYSKIVECDEKVSARFDTLIYTH